MNRYFDIENDEQLAGFAADLGVAFPEASTEHLESAHVAAMMDAVGLLADKGESVARPASKADGPENQASGLPKLGRASQMYEKLFATKGAKIATATAALLFAFAGVAAASGLGTLPDPVQNAVANGVAPLGLDLPGGDDEVAEEAAEAAEEAAEAAREVAEEAAEAAEEAAGDAEDRDEDADADMDEDADDRDEDADDSDEDADADMDDEADDRDEDADDRDEDADDSDEDADADMDDEADDSDEDADADDSDMDADADMDDEADDSDEDAEDLGDDGGED